MWKASEIVKMFIAKPSGWPVLYPQIAHGRRRKLTSMPWHAWACIHPHKHTFVQKKTLNVIKIIMWKCFWSLRKYSFVYYYMSNQSLVERNNINRLFLGKFSKLIQHIVLLFIVIQTSKPYIQKCFRFFTVGSWF